jgi:hypothetical protein
VRYTKTLTTPYDLSRCLYDGLTKVSELAYSEPRLAACLPLWGRHDIAVPGLSARGIGAADGIRFPVGEPAPGLPGFRRTHQQALSAQAVALAAGPSGQLVTASARSRRWP